MIIEDSIKVKDYKCFGSVPQGFDKIFPINIVIGKNNAGKSSLIDLIEYVIKPKEDFIKTGWGGVSSEVIISHTLDTDEAAKATTEVTTKASVAESIFKGEITSFENKIHYRLHPGSVHLITKTSRLEFKDAIQHAIKKPFDGKLFKRITAERDL